MFEREDWTLFRSLDSLSQKAGVSRSRLAQVVIKELCDNALDAGATGRGTTATFEAGPGRSAFYTVSDDGPGIAGSDQDIAHLFSFRRGLLSSKLLRLPTRGALGNGLRVVMGAVSATGGAICVSTRGRTLELVPQPDGTSHIREVTPWAGTGTTVRVKLGGSSDLPGVNESALLLARNAIAMAFLEGASRYSGLSSPHWYSNAAFYELCQGWTGTLRGLLANLRLGRATRKIENEIANGFDPAVDLDASARALPPGTASGVLRVLKSMAPEVKPGELGAVGQGLRIDGKATGYSVRRGSIDRDEAKLPYVVEVWAAKGGAADDAERSTAMFYVNRTPTAAPAHMGKGERGKSYVSGASLNNYVSTGKKPVTLFVNITTPYMPITTDGKEPDFRPYFDEIDNAIKSACRQIGGPAPGETRVPLADRIGEVLDDAVAAASGDGAAPYSLRGLFYKVRPLIMGMGLEAPEYKYFCSVIADIESTRGGDLPGMYRDARGMLYHPHTGEQIPLGTREVAEYSRRAWGFNKVLYIEKGGLLTVLRAARWPERHDCAVLTSQGQATRAVKDLIDMIGGTAADEPVQVFCLHDADGYGTVIYEKLKEETRARGARRIEIHNLGLDPWEGYQMGLEAESFERRKQAVPVAEYVRDWQWSGPADRLRRHPNGDDGTEQSWSSWLQTNRYELDAMSSTQFVAWLDRKIAVFDDDRAAGKVVPNRVVVLETAEVQARARVREELVARLMREHDVDAQVNRIMRSEAVVEGLCEITPGRVAERLEEDPDGFWANKVAALAKRVADRALSGASPSGSSGEVPGA